MTAHIFRTPTELSQVMAKAMLQGWIKPAGPKIIKARGGESLRLEQRWMMQRLRLERKGLDASMYPARVRNRI